MQKKVNCFNCFKFTWIFRFFCVICRHKSFNSSTPPKSCHLSAQKQVKIFSIKFHKKLYRNARKWIYFFSVGYLVTSVVDRLIGRCIARRFANKGTSSTPPVIIHVLGFTYLQFFLIHLLPLICSHRRFAESSKFRLRVDAKFSFSVCCCGIKYFALQSQKQLAQHCAGNFNWLTVSLDCLVWSAALTNGDSSSSFGGVNRSWSNVCNNVLSVHPIDFINDWPIWRGLRHGAPPGPHLPNDSCLKWNEIFGKINFMLNKPNMHKYPSNHINRISWKSTALFTGCHTHTVKFHFILIFLVRRRFISQIVFYVFSSRIIERNTIIWTEFCDYLTGWISQWCTATPSFQTIRRLKCIFSTILKIKPTNNQNVRMMSKANY